MNEPKYFKENLLLYKERNNLSMTKFAEKLDMPRTTVYAVVSDGQTTLDTACRIANNLQMPLCTMVGGVLEDYKVDVYHGILKIFSWYDNLTEDKQAIVRKAFAEIFRVLDSKDE